MPKLCCTVFLWIQRGHQIARQKTALQKLFVHKLRTSKLASFFIVQGRMNVVGGWTEGRIKSFTILVAQIVLLPDKKVAPVGVE